MTVITYTAKRNVAPGREVGEVYSFEVALSELTAQSLPDSNTSTSLSGVRHTLLHRIDKTRSLAILPINKLGDQADLARQIDEWADSVAAGETFTLDEFGSPGAPIEEMAVKLDGEVRPSMTNSVGYYSYTFRVILAI